MNKRDLINRATRFQASRAKFAEFIKQMVQLQNEIPTLQFFDSTDADRMKFTLLGQKYLLRLRAIAPPSDADARVELYARVEKAEDYSLKKSFEIDELGNARTEGQSKWPLDSH